MTDNHPPNIFTGGSPLDIVTRYYGYWYRLKDLQDLQFSDRRVPGGISSHIEMAQLYWLAANQALDDLVEPDPDTVQAVQEVLAVSAEPVFQNKAKELAKRLREREERQGT
jgi:hypothetical protein